ncbi:hypothetical protein Maes01_01815 [Microbulbifer aestuariivivens]|uniref:Uncharacterized protein n=1 Tax=Microbulbifer aestuariivivens TaxID=1908308 RepID=A0ABP9WT29_9GAMM
MSEMQGGRFKHGFTSAGIVQAFSGGIDLIDAGAESSVMRVIAAAVLGGTASVASGGKFANGAITGAFSRAFNDEAQHGAQKNSGARRYAARQARAALGSTTMPELESGIYPFVKDAALIGIVEVSDLWLIDTSGEQVLHYISIGSGLDVGARYSREFGAMYLPTTQAIPGFAGSFDVDGTLIFGGSGSLLGNPIGTTPYLAPSTSGGPSFGISVGAGPFGSYTSFQKVYSYDEAPSHLPLGR